MVLISIVNRAYKPTYNWGASHSKFRPYLNPHGMMDYHGENSG